MLFVQGLQILDNITDGREAADVVVLDNDSEFVLAQHNEIGKLNRVDAKVVGKLCVKGDVLTVDLKLFYEQICKLIKHNMSPLDLIFVSIHLIITYIFQIVKYLTDFFKEFIRILQN